MPTPHAGIRVDAVTICGTDLHILKGPGPARRRLPQSAASRRPGRGHLDGVTDIVPTGCEVGVFNGEVRPGQVVAVVGAGPIGLSAIMDSRMDRPSHIVAVQVINSRLEAAKSFGADVVNGSGEDAMEVVHQLTGGLGADVALEAGRGGHLRVMHPLIRPDGRVRAGDARALQVVLGRNGV